eukprot:4878592-Alexandrium_andersonii.AAC.1
MEEQPAPPPLPSAAPPPVALQSPQGPTVEEDPAAAAETNVAIGFEWPEDLGVATGVSSLSPVP